MAAAASKSKIHRAPPKRCEIKFKEFKTIAKSLQNLATGVAGEEKKAAGNRVGSSGSLTPVELVGELKPASKHRIKQNQPRRGQIKIKIFKMIANSVQNLAGRAAGEKKKSAGNGGIGGCFSSRAIVIPVETVGGLKPASGSGIKQKRRERGKIFITVAGSVIEFSESGEKDETAAVERWFSSAAGIVQMKL
ncbi:hypothetical protein Lser_V15G42262 [Lactuca serriola]|uniref:Uncharacterized protein n=1 Tax=Lactuca sativa TaxID=4236 RepID=A0A9R1WP47_LACSA|nr:hypothetical protein LSAT_V11C900463620 [Lactuca sativa]